VIRGLGGGCSLSTKGLDNLSCSVNPCRLYTSGPRVRLMTDVVATCTQHFQEQTLSPANLPEIPEKDSVALLVFSRRFSFFSSVSAIVRASAPSAKERLRGSDHPKEG